MAGMPTFNVDYSGIWETAGSMADNEIAPQLAAIEAQLQAAGYTADESKKAIDEAYPIARRSLQKSIYENYVAGEGSLAAMGTGRGGGRRELLGRAGEREATGIEAIETQRARDVGAVQRTLDLYKTQAGTQKASLAGQRGNLQNTYNAQLRATRFNEASTRYGNELAGWNAAENARQFDAQMAAARAGAESAGSYAAATGTSGTSGSNTYRVPDLSGYFPEPVKGTGYIPAYVNQIAASKAVPKPVVKPVTTSLIGFGFRR